MLSKKQLEGNMQTEIGQENLTIVVGKYLNMKNS